MKTMKYRHRKYHCLFPKSVTAVLTVAFSLCFPCPLVSCVCILSTLFMWHGCGYLLPAPGLPLLAHVLVITSSKYCSISKPAPDSFLLFCYLYWLFHPPASSLVGLFCFLFFLRYFTEGCFTKSGLSWVFLGILDKLCSFLVSWKQWHIQYCGHLMWTTSLFKIKPVSCQTLLISPSLWSQKCQLF